MLATHWVMLHYDDFGINQNLGDKLSKPTMLPLDFLAKPSPSYFIQIIVDLTDFRPMYSEKLLSVQIVNKNMSFSEERKMLCPLQDEHESFVAFQFPTEY